ncbi:single-stranded DNA-binding protein [Clostridium paraputrificum]|uniref:single-stranded DNA-binding protein n=1 Tax=Clostridium paraputrificum TaxID=29363 RepID=UPI0018970EB8|nr:single-stranded DNA-binding protein [Clostridium paraputrificum]MDC0801400.1 single-stranded DNA-binding protein [Clostridium paraputrificum]
MNSINLIGRLTRDPELRFASGSGMTICKFNLAVPREFKKDETDFINCTAFGKTAEVINQYMTKGRQIGITGRLQTGSYDAQDGSKRYTADVIVTSLTFVGSNQENTGADRSSYQSNNNSINDTFGSSTFEDDITPVDDGDMPF